MGSTTPIAKANGGSSRSPELAVNAEANARTKETGKTASAAKAREAAPILEREQASEVLRQVRLQLFPENRAATVHLNPAELGRVSIRVIVEGDQVQAVVRAETPEALAALEQHMPELQASLGDRGFQDAQLDLALGFEGEDKDSTQGSRSEEPTPTQIHRLFANAEGVDYYA